MTQRKRPIRQFPLHLIVLLAVGFLVLGFAYFTHVDRPVFLDIGSQADSASLAGFYDREGEPDSSYRWTGPLARIVFPNRANEPWTLVLGADAPRPEGAGQPQVSLHANHQLIDRFVAAPGIRDYSFTYSPATYRPTDLILTIETETFAPPGDPRQLGLLVNSVALRPAGEMSRVQQLGLAALRLVPGLVLSGMVYWLLRETMVRPTPSLAVALLMTLLVAWGAVTDVLTAGLVERCALVMFPINSALAIVYRARVNRPAADRMADAAGRTGRFLGRLLSPRTPKALASWTGAHRVDLVAAALLFLAALLVRLPYYLEMPHVTDEFREVQIAAEVAAGSRYPLFFGSTDYLGVVHSYLLGLFLRVVGISPYSPRLYMVLVGSLTVALTFWWAREMGSRRFALLAAALMLTSPLHILMGSHVAWMNSTTPVFCLIMFIALYHGTVHERGAVLALTGLSAGLALQTHPTVAFLFPGMAGWYLVRRLRDGYRLRRTLFRPAVYGAILLFLLSYGNMLWLNAQGRLHALSAAQRRDALHESSLSAIVYVQTLLDMIGNLLVSLSGSLAQRLTPGTGIQAVLLAYGAWLAFGLVCSARWRSGLLPALILPPLVLFPLINKDWIVPDKSRYLFYLLPIAYLAMARTLLAIRALWRRGATSSSWRAVAWQFAVVAVIALPLLPLARFYQTYGESDWSNSSMLLTARLLRQQPVPVYVDVALADAHQPIVGCNLLKAIEYQLFLDGTPCDVISLRPLDKPPRTFDHPVEFVPATRLPQEAWMVLSPSTAAEIGRTRLLTAVPELKSEARFGLYRLAPAENDSADGPVDP